ncbi:hypothetical protein M6B38_369105 [Iris pallida]|uniref:Secreted protein n=1 Tax=Iris pallida TaxID=29817 RepID=A0AAX6GFC2_IRIPA|nr:hypothetical protein M6B38_369105 [Iris pallida]
MFSLSFFLSSLSLSPLSARGAPPPELSHSSFEPPPITGVLATAGSSSDQAIFRRQPLIRSLIEDRASFLVFLRVLCRLLERCAELVG